MAYDKFEVLTSTAYPLPIENVDTDQIIPARFLKATERKDFDKNFFYDWRYNAFKYSCFNTSLINFFYLC